MINQFVVYLFGIGKSWFRKKNRIFAVVTFAAERDFLVVGQLLRAFTFYSDDVVIIVNCNNTEIDTQIPSPPSFVFAVRRRRRRLLLLLFFLSFWCDSRFLLPLFSRLVNQLTSCVLLLLSSFFKGPFYLLLSKKTTQLKCYCVLHAYKKLLPFR